MGFLTETEEFGLRNAGGGAAEEKFSHALQEVIRNMQDPNTSHKAARKVVLEVTFSPYEDRSGADIVINCKSTLAPIKAFPSHVLIGQGPNGKVEMRELLSGDLFPRSTADNVFQLQKGDVARHD